MNQQANEQTNERSHSPPDTHTPEMQRWTDLRRSFLTVVAAVQRVIPNGVYTLDIQIVTRNPSERM